MPGPRSPIPGRSRSRLEASENSHDIRMAESPLSFCKGAVNRQVLTACACWAKGPNVRSLVRQITNWDSIRRIGERCHANRAKRASNPARTVHAAVLQ